MKGGPSQEDWDEKAGGDQRERRMNFDTFLSGLTVISLLDALKQAGIPEEDADEIARMCNVQAKKKASDRADVLTYL